MPFSIVSFSFLTSCDSFENVPIRFQSEKRWEGYRKISSLYTHSWPFSTIFCLGQTLEKENSNFDVTVLRV